MIAGIFFLANHRPIYAGDEAASPSLKQKIDSVQVLRSQYRAKQTWEHIVSFLGTLVSFPVVWFLEAQEKLAGFVDEKKLVPKTYEFFTSADERRGIMPTYSSRSGVGLEFYQEGLVSPHSELDINVSGGLHNRQRYEAEMENVQFFHGFLSIDFSGGYRYLPGESFFGLGPDTRHSNEKSYDHELTSGQLGFNFHASKSFVFNTGFGLSHHNIFKADDDDPPVTQFFTGETLPGLTTKIRIARVEAGITLDTRNRLGNPTRGNEFTLAGILFSQPDGSEFEFYKITADLRQYIHLFHNRVLALRLAGESTEPLSQTDRIPFYYLSSLGRHETIRGFDRGRFRDRDMVFGSVEYRIPLWHSLDAALFVDSGQVAGNIFNELSPDKFQFGYGIGLRLWDSKDLIATMELALSKERFRAYFELN